MSQPPNYTPTTDFSQQEALSASGRSTVNTAALDAEFANIETTLDQTLVNLALLQRDDGRLKDLSCEIHTISPEVLTLMGGFKLRGLWAAFTEYEKNDICSNGAYTYVCRVTHSSGGVFDSSNWAQFGFTSGADASQAAADAQASASAAAGSSAAAFGYAQSAAESAATATDRSGVATSGAATAIAKAGEASTSATGAAISANAASAAAASVGIAVDWVNHIFAAGTRMPFAQAAAPTGWTQDTTDSANNRMLRVVNTAGGGVAGTNSPILNNVVPSHTHTFTTGTESTNHTHYDAGHQHGTAVGGNGSAGSAGAGVPLYGSSATSVSNAILGSQSVQHTHSGTTVANPGAAVWSPRYIDMIICAKN